ncbi:PadR family transcriptional regulator [Leptospira sp. GIMC2001]|uniref:PadR family transcriptional regulator n=1 Tax=Leptospira sp. GIMC2001 TaxID=1513297 RepID=UPI00234AAD98|nr:PadR family transcriptional regulator [Leptospira sp. GIMC2001]WCL50857.1 PadR family transcriptional regulator [Leptospira sp. GIMC2001]
MLKYAILGFLKYRPMFGYELKQAMDGSIQHFWNSKLSQIYATLKTLEAEKKLLSKIENQDDKPDRKRYTITQSGIADLDNWLATPLMTLSQTKDELLLKLFFGGSLNKSDILMDLRLMHKLHEDKLKVYQTTTKEIIQASRESHPEWKNDTLLWESTRRMGEMYEEMYIQWLNETIQNIEKKWKNKK